MKSTKTIKIGYDNELVITEIPKRKWNGKRVTRIEVEDEHDRIMQTKSDTYNELRNDEISNGKLLMIGIAIMFLVAAIYGIGIMIYRWR